MSTDTERQLTSRLQRIETRMIRGFEEMGVRVQDDTDWFRVDHDRKMVYLKTLGKSISAVRLAMKAAHCPLDETYTIAVKGTPVCTIRLGDTL